MPSYPFRDGNGSLKHISVASGIGTEADPFVLNPQQGTVASYTTANVNIQPVGGQILAGNTGRKHAILLNRSTTDTCELFWGSLGTSGTGYPLLPGKEYAIDKNNLFTGAIFGKTPAGTPPLVIFAMEGV
jgi:hypothetical protein